ncbi:MAG: UPF0175 family protein [Cyanobacteria bacterium P01_H01_bin.15]
MEAVSALDTPQLAAAGLFIQQDELSPEKASEILGMSQIQFPHLLDKREICVHYDIVEFREDLQHFRKIRTS